MKRFYVVCTGVTLVLVGITAFFRSEPTKFYGIADTKETILNADAPVAIKKISVVQGQTVDVGDTLVILERPELDLKLSEISHMLSEYKARKTYQTTSSLSEKRKIQAEQVERVNEINAKIRELEAQYEMNKKLVAELRSVKKEDEKEDDSMSHPILTQIKSLRHLLESARNPTQIQIERINKQLSNTDDPLGAQVQRLSDELSLLQQEKEKLIMCAQISGMIGTVKFKEGEKVSPFDTILTLHAAAPSYVKGYIHENVYSHVTVGDTVTVKSFADAKQGVSGQVVGVGSRIVDYPERLRKRQDIPIWGREVIIKIPENNSFLLGEKVLISVMQKKKFHFPLVHHLMVPDIHAAELPRESHAENKLRDITIQKGLSATPLEASGLCYLPDVKLYLLASDDTDSKRPVLFLMNPDGHITGATQVRGLKRINDIEGITQDREGFLYLLASQSYNRKGKQATERKLFVRLKRSGTTLALDKSAMLFDALIDAAGKNNKSEWGTFLLKAAREKSIDIEGVTFLDDTLLLGFKNPRMGSNAVILSITQPGSLFSSGKLEKDQIQVWRKMKIVDDSTGTFCGVSDLCWHENRLYGVSTGVRTSHGLTEDVGVFWSVAEGNGQPERFKFFRNRKPEGLAFNSDRNEFCLVFDNGSKKPSQMMIVKVSL
jgi:multidrug resistance efflux pump